MEWCRLQAYAADGNAFAQQILMRHPAQADRVETCLAVLERVRGSDHLVDLLAGRDAAQQLCMIALANHCEDQAAVFSAQYDGFCRALLVYFAGGEVC